MSEEVKRMLDEVERSLHFIGARYEVERLRNLMDEMSRAIYVMSEQLRRHVELEEEE